MESLLTLLAAVLLGAGSLFAMIGGVGILRFPDFFTRMHGAGITDTLGAGLILTGLMIHAGLSLITVKLMMILFLLWVSSPTSTHALARSALAHGLKPLVADGNEDEGEDRDRHRDHDKNPDHDQDAEGAPSPN